MIAPPGKMAAFFLSEYIPSMMASRMIAIVTPVYTAIQNRVQLHHTWSNRYTVEYIRPNITTVEVARRFSAKCDCDSWCGIRPSGSGLVVGQRQGTMGERRKAPGRLVAGVENRLSTLRHIMPNWCFNSLTVSGSRDDLLVFAEQARGTSLAAEGELPLSLHALVPAPDLGNDAKGYEWRRKTWGTKRDLDGVDFHDCEMFLCYRFATAWSPPRNWLGLVSGQFPDLRFELAYAEPGEIIAGELVCEEGSVRTMSHTVERERYNAIVWDRFGGDEGLLVDEEPE